MQLPRWIAPRRGETADDVAFQSGAALGALHLVLAAPGVPLALLRERLALSAAQACVGLVGRPERAADLRDAIHLARPGDALGPAGETYAMWRRAVERPVTVKALARALPQIEPAEIGGSLDAGRGGPVARAAGVLGAVLDARPRDEGAALILAEAALAQSLGWSHVTPMLWHLSGRDLRKRGADLQLACHLAVRAGAGEVARLAGELTRRAARMEAVAPKLRAKGAGEAVALFLSCDAVAPGALTRFMSDRAARRLCDRLVDLDAVRELTGRESFRLYGV